MQLIASAYGIVTLRVSADDVCPKGGVLQRDLVKFVGDAYQFSVRPNIPSGVPFVPVLLFQSGKLTTENVEYVIQQVSIQGNGNAVICANTEHAEIVLQNLIERLESELNYTYKGKRQRKNYLSGLVVQFDVSIESRITAFKKMEEIFSSAMPRSFGPFKPKTIAFGFGDPTVETDVIEAIDKSDFVLQRRAGEPYEENRYFSTMPLSTQRHLEVLQDIERALK